MSFLSTALDAFGRQQRERYYAPSGDPEQPFKSDARDTLFRLDDHGRRRGICAPQWTSGVGCGAWASNSMKAAFRENEIDDTVLPSLTQEDLKVQARVRAAIQGGMYRSKKLGRDFSRRTWATSSLAVRPRPYHHKHRSAAGQFRRIPYTYRW